MLYRDFASQDDIDAQYNIERQVPDARRWLEFFVEASARTRSATLESSENSWS